MNRLYQTDVFGVSNLCMLTNKLWDLRHALREQFGLEIQFIQAVDQSVEFVRGRSRRVVCRGIMRRGGIAGRFLPCLAQMLVALLQGDFIG